MSAFIPAPALRGPDGLAVIGRTIHDLRGIRFDEGEGGNTPEAPEDAPSGGDPNKTYTQADIDRILKAEIKKATEKFADYDELKALADSQKSEVQKQIDALQAERDEALSKLAKAEREAAIALLPEDRREKYRADESVSVEAIRILAAELKDAPKSGPRVDPAKLRPGALTAADRTAAARAAAVAALKASK